MKCSYFRTHPQQFHPMKSHPVKATQFIHRRLIHCNLFCSFLNSLFSVVLYCISLLLYWFLSSLLFPNSQKNLIVRIDFRLVGKVCNKIGSSVVADASQDISPSSTRKNERRQKYSLEFRISSTIKNTFYTYLVPSLKVSLHFFINFALLHNFISPFCFNGRHFGLLEFSDPQRVFSAGLAALDLS